LFGAEQALEWNARSFGVHVNDRLAPPAIHVRVLAMQGNRAEGVSLAQEQVTEFGLADAGRALQHGVEHCLKLAGRARDDLEDLGGRCLLLERLAEIVGALASLVEQACVLDGDPRLGGEILHQRNLLVCEWSNFLPVDGDGTNQPAFLEHRHLDEGARTGKFDQSDRQGIVLLVSRVLRVVGNVEQLLRCGHAHEGMQRARMQRSALRDIPGESRRRIMPRADAEFHFRIKCKKPKLASQRRIAFARMLSKTGSNSPGELEMTCSTSEVAVCRSSDTRSSLSRRVFSMAMTACTAKFLTRSICLSVNGRTSVV